MNPRIAAHRRIAAALEALSDNAFAELVHAGTPLGTGIGGTSTLLDVDGTPVFAKRVPLTDLERAHPQSTANVFDLPPHTHYGIGSPGGGVWRELAAHTMLSDGVPSGRTENFPLLHHWRTVPGAPPSTIDASERREMLDVWENAPTMRHRLDELTAASASVVLCMEYLPTTLHDWLNEHLADGTVDEVCPELERRLLRIAADLRAHRVLHFDAHFENILLDGNRLCLGDFGLATSPDFRLDTVESEFVRLHHEHDLAYLLMYLVYWLSTALAGITDRRERRALIRSWADGAEPTGFPPNVTAILRRHAPVAAVLGEFYARLREESPRVPFPAAELAHALR